MSDLANPDGRVHIYCLDCEKELASHESEYLEKYRDKEKERVIY